MAIQSAAAEGDLAMASKQKRELTILLNLMDMTRRCVLVWKRDPIIPFSMESPPFHAEIRFGNQSRHLILEPARPRLGVFHVDGGLDEVLTYNGTGLMDDLCCTVQHLCGGPAGGEFMDNHCSDMPDFGNTRK